MADKQHLCSFSALSTGREDHHWNTGIHDHLSRHIVLEEIELLEVSFAETIRSQPDDDDFVLDGRVQHQSRGYVRNRAQGKDIDRFACFPGNTDQIQGCGILRIESVRVITDSFFRPSENRIFSPASGNLQDSFHLPETQFHPFCKTRAPVVVERGGMQRQDIYSIRSNGVGDGILVIHFVVGVAVYDDIFDPGSIQVFQYLFGGNGWPAGSFAATRERHPDCQ